MREIRLGGRCDDGIWDVWVRSSPLDMVHRGGRGGSISSWADPQPHRIFAALVDPGFCPDREFDCAMDSRVHGMAAEKG
jgi:hypothetical protein